MSDEIIVHKETVKGMFVSGYWQFSRRRWQDGKSTKTAPINRRETIKRLKAGLLVVARHEEMPGQVELRLRK